MLQRLKTNYVNYIFIFVAVALVIYMAPRLMRIFGSVTWGWDTDFDKSNVSMDEIISGGVGKDGIPPIDEPTFEAVAEVDWLEPQSPVITVAFAGVARAYPLEILTQHEIVNDEINGLPIAVTYCPLCNSAIVYDRRIDEQTLRFGVSGNLRNSDLIMWDDVTESWWQQLTGEGIVGAYTGEWLKIVPSQVVGYSEFSERYPEGEVLRGNYGRSYGRNPYVGYDSNPHPFLFRGQADNRLFPTERVLAIRFKRQAVAYPYSKLREQGVIHDTLFDTDVIAFWKAGANSALDAPLINASRDVGMAALFEREVNGQSLTFYADENGRFFDHETNSEWNIFGEAIAGELAGQTLTKLNAFPHLWFAWAAFHPDTQIYEAS